MFNTKSLFSIAPAALLLLAATGNVQAATNAQMVITGTVVAATCDVSLSTNNLDLGNHTPSSFISAARPVAASLKQFTVGINNCQTPLAANDSAGLIVSGATLGGNPAIFNNSGTNAGVMLHEVGATAGSYIRTGAKLELAKAPTPTANEFNGQSISIEAGLASSTSGAAVQFGQVNAPILFSFAYN